MMPFQINTVLAFFGETTSHYRKELEIIQLGGHIVPASGSHRER
jgi:hypothetical protein